MKTILLSRSGKPPLKITGELLLDSDGSVDVGRKQNRWHSISIYRTATGYAAAVEYHTEWQGEPGWADATTGTAQAIAKWLSDINPAHYVTGFPAGQQFADRQAKLISTLRHLYAEQMRHLLSGRPEFAEDGETGDDAASEMKAHSLVTNVFQRIKADRTEWQEWARRAPEALKQLCAYMAKKTDQSSTIRALLYSLWNGQPASLLDIVKLDWSVRKDLLTVLYAFGVEAQPSSGGNSFFYDEVSEAIKAAGLWEWFVGSEK